MQEKSKSYAPAGTGIAAEPLEYWNGWLNTTPATLQDYSVTISCGDPDSAVSALKAKIYNDCTTNIDAVEYLTATVGTSKTATVRACM